MPDTAPRPLQPRVVLRRPMASDAAPTWSGAVWVGGLDVRDVPADADTVIGLDASDGHATARLLVRDGTAPLGFVDLPLQDGTFTAGALRRAISALPPAEHPPVPVRLPSTSVVLCTRDRADQLEGALRSLLALDHPDFEIVVVDNAPSDESTRDLVTTVFTDPRVRYVREPTPGLSTARNAGVRAARHEIVAFTDDDVVVDRGWLRAIASGFSRGADVDCVSGLVASGELRTPAQRYFDDRVTWSRNLVPRVYRLATPPADRPLFPFSVGDYGTGANFAMRRDALTRLGGFDEALGVGTVTGGGEDIDMFSRVVLAGSALVVEPAALVWHRHRADVRALRTQAAGYGTGLGAWLTKTALRPRTLGMALVRAPRAVRHLLVGEAMRPAAAGDPTTDPIATGPTPTGPTTTSPATPPAAVVGADAAFEREVARVRWVELWAVARGVGRYARSRRTVLARAAALQRASGATAVRS
ncbi:glycosyltransferase family 2 protein [Curtobacterium sp. ISL-83]|uniref:glycosyltransferase family 2 protein n=1 Tax=Curtobacterium sp. ISL-83 TaxID=2819145 RepID=UPI001BEBB8F1|nr:glycosyltransferase family 2 protein [Curtobacterium sp. ISL-83]MBT2501653.1 glycosyltransferase [Curtobacterium sp. ISL-83]